MPEYDSIDPAVRERMQREWNDRAREDAHFYVAFGRRDQDPEEFFATASDVVRSLKQELARLGPATNPRARRALEIGCGPGRLMRPMAAHFGEIHGVDVSDEMIRRAQANLSGLPWAHPHHSSGADLAQFADESFDLVYSYAVFQHIPSREVVMNYLREAHRVLKPGGVLRVQLNGLDQTARTYDTWSGVRISADEIAEFAAQFDMQLLALEGARTQYMWTTMRKRFPGFRAAGGADPEVTRIRRITNAHNSEPVAPLSGRFASVTVWIEHLPEMVDLNSLQVRVDGLSARPSYIGLREPDGLQQLNAFLPQTLTRTGLVPIELFWNERPLSQRRYVRVIPRGPQVPVLMSVSDGINLMSGTDIVTGTVKVTIEESPEPVDFGATIAGIPVTDIDVFCADPLPPRWEINLRLPPEIPTGPQNLQLRLGKREIATVGVQISSR